MDVAYGLLDSLWNQHKVNLLGEEGKKQTF